MYETETVESATLRGLSRRDFTLRAVLAMLSGVTITISGCGGGGGGNPGSPSQPNPPAGPGDKVGNISANHGHTAVITSAQLTAGGALTLNIRGDSDHPHTVDITAAEVVMIRDGQRVSKTSSMDVDHNHIVTFN